ncbi:ABC transporter permease [Defluviimonas sp. WL0050]|uniref:ABC transporter permease n=1 Tax=Albidovulum litorale TaxID=2984134 RepID=A0ABT2ZT05_9RHOB|nr:ABC transporter permease [Defluviimonas sp. WL0050]MCV2874292.1 ABC transporter permease [Defluviimonas sp. WL0050]
MDFGSINPAVLIASLMVAAVPIMLAALGELIVEKSGVLNLGVEGMMIIGAIAGFIVAVNTGSPVVGFIGGAMAGAALSLIFACLTQFLLTNQVATGLALTLFGLGLSSLAGQGYNGIKPPPTGAVPFGPLADIPFFGRVLFGHDWMVYFSILMVAVTWWVLKSTRLGLIIRAVGENHEAAHSLGYKVTRVRIGCIMFGGAMAGMGGAYVSLVRVPQWIDGITSGAGWIALAIVVFASWRPWRVMIGAYLFGGITVLQLNLQAAGSAIPVEYLSMAPYLITILVLVIMSSGRGKASLNAPASLGQNFHASH